MINLIKKLLFKNRKNKKSIDIHEILFESDVANATDLPLNRYEPILSRSHSRLPLILIVLVAFLFSGRIYALQQDTRQLSTQATKNAFSSLELVANRGIVYDRNQVPLIWNVTTPDSEFASRNYISEPGFVHLLGFISPPLKDNNNQFSRSTYEARAGVEKVFDDTLQGDNGEIRRQLSSKSETASGVQVEAARPGQDLILSIDAGLQAALYNSIKSLSEKVGFEKGTGAIMNIETGELLAITNYPEYTRDFDNAAADQSYLNLFTHGLFTPGSVIKPFVALAALNENVVSPNKQILSTRTIVVPNRFNPSNPTYFSDWKAHGMVDVKSALAQSSNAYFYAIGGGLYDQDGIGIDTMNKYMKSFGLGEPAGVVGFEEISGVVPSKSWKTANFEDGTWRLGDTFLSSIGQYGWQVTPLHVLRGVAAIANRGTLIKPTVQKGAVLSSGPVSINISNQNYRIIHEGMRQAAVEGTARGLNVPYVDIAAKTGTAELGVSKASVNSWVMGFWPYNEPKYAFVVMMSEGSRYNLTGATFAMRETFDWMRDNRPNYLDINTNASVKP